MSDILGGRQVHRTISSIAEPSRKINFALEKSLQENNRWYFFYLHRWFEVMEYVVDLYSHKSRTGKTYCLPTIT